MNQRQQGNDQYRKGAQQSQIPLGYQQTNQTYQQSDFQQRDQRIGSIQESSQKNYLQMNDIQFQQIQQQIQNEIKNQLLNAEKQIKKSMQIHIDNELYQLKNKSDNIQASYQLIANQIDQYNQEIQTIKQQLNSNQQSQGFKHNSQQNTYLQPILNDISFLKQQSQNHDQAIQEIRFNLNQNCLKSKNANISISELDPPTQKLQNMLMDQSKQLKNDIEQLQKSLAIYDDDHQKFKALVTNELAIVGNTNIISGIKKNFDEIKLEINKLDDDQQRFKVFITQDIASIGNKNNQLEQKNFEISKQLQNIYNQLYTAMKKENDNNQKEIHLKLNQIFNFMQKCEQTNEKVEEIQKCINLNLIKDLIENVNKLVIDVKNLQFNRPFRK